MIFLKHELVLLVKQLTEDQNEDKNAQKKQQVKIAVFKKATKYDITVHAKSLEFVSYKTMAQTLPLLPDSAV